MSARREGSRTRRAPFRQPNRQIVVVCGGVRTEPCYLRALVGRHRNPALRIKVIGKGDDPASLVEYAVSALGRELADLDEAWCVFDVDEFVLDGAVQRAKAAGVRLAVSNPCFELWLLLHYEDCRAEVDGARDALRRLRRHVPTYDKTQLDFVSFADGVTAATARARQLDDGADPPGPNPSSGMWRLVELIRKEGAPR